MRKLRSTEISGKVNTPNSQWRQKADFCLNCHGVNMHYNGCKSTEVYPIPSTAEVPKKSSNKRKWDIFKKQFVFARPVGATWWYLTESWWYKNVFKKSSIYIRSKNLPQRNLF